MSTTHKGLAPATQFLMILVPFVINGFFAVYALVGYIIEGRDKFNWSVEAGQVALWVGLISIGFCMLSLAYASWRNGGWVAVPKSLKWSSIVQALLAVVLMLMIVAALRMD